MATGLQTDPGFNGDADNLPSWGLGETVTFDETLHPARWRTYVVDELVQPFVTGVVQEQSHYEKFLSTRRRSEAGKSTLARYPKLITFHGDIRPDVLTPAPGSVPSASNKPPVMNFTSRSKQHFVEGVVDGTLVDACPDSGADRCFMSPRLASDLGLYPADGTQKRIVLANKKHVESPGMVKVPWSAYARKIGLAIDRDFENWLEVEFADGTTAWTSGVVRDASWEVGGKTVRCDFHVLEELSVDAIVSNNYLFDLNIFSEYGGCFFDIDSEEDLFELCNIRLIGRYGDGLNVLEQEYLEDVTSPNAFDPEMVQRELARRDQIRDEILALPDNEREVATQAEAERQRRWQDLRQAHWTSGGAGRWGWSPRGYQLDDIVEEKDPHYIHSFEIYEEEPEG
ncbi:hypothetical protein SAPIO_CDS4754 [Scedosporium apiospermum]|uniref:Uncharacterized protein n=1 Tax=Pseudallescheria apiosperma TaxID=563466 RepID=A0A084G7J8_PSEDA|nr:uncharacterized protein SAPIO_CDS4754 [Scedosporium apiospermum]KEZ43310.1 hypothetical protein SAPIO_CDS4754 [Scedosporium apiospermum]